MNKVIKAIKDSLEDTVCLFKMGSFYHCYDTDAYILSYFFNYKLKDSGREGKECGFPVDSLNKIIVRLENKKINYVIVDNKDQYDEKELVNFKAENKYQYYYLKATGYLNCRARVDNIHNFLIKNIEAKKDFRRILSDIECIIYEGKSPFWNDC